MKPIKLMSILSLLGLFACGSGYNNLSTEEFAKAIAAGEMAVVDVRTPDEYAAGHLHGASNCDWFAAIWHGPRRRGRSPSTPWRLS